MFYLILQLGLRYHRAGEYEIEVERSPNSKDQDEVAVTQSRRYNQKQNLFSTSAQKNV